MVVPWIITGLAIFLFILVLRDAKKKDNPVIETKEAYRLADDVSVSLFDLVQAAEKEALPPTPEAEIRRQNQLVSQIDVTDIAQKILDELKSNLSKDQEIDLGYWQKFEGTDYRMDVTVNIRPLDWSNI